MRVYQWVNNTGSEKEQQNRIDEVKKRAAQTNEEAVDSLRTDAEQNRQLEEKKLRKKSRINIYF